MSNFLSILAVLGLIVLLVSCSVEENKRFEAQMQTEYKNCIIAKETEYTCKSYVQSMRAKKAADDAGMMAAVSVGMSVANSGNNR